MWLLENPTPILFLGVLTAAILVVALYMTGRLVFVFALFGSIIVFGILLMTEQLIVTDVEAVEATLDEIAYVVSTNDLDAVLRHISPTATKLRTAAQNRLSQVVLSNADIIGRIDVTVDVNQPRRTAVAQFTGRVVWSDKQGLIQEKTYVRFFVVRFRKEDDHWLVTEFEEHDPISQGNQVRLTPILDGPNNARRAHRNGHRSDHPHPRVGDGNHCPNYRLPCELSPRSTCIAAGLQKTRAGHDAACFGRTMERTH